MPVAFASSAKIGVYYANSLGRIGVEHLGRWGLNERRPLSAALEKKHLRAVYALANYYALVSFQSI